MSKGLESLERLKNTLLAEGYWQDVLQDVAIVEKELKALNIIKIILKDFIEFNIIELPHINKVHYEIKIFNDAIYVSKEKYDLLKEVLNA